MNDLRSLKKVLYTFIFCVVVFEFVDTLYVIFRYSFELIKLILLKSSFRQLRDGACQRRVPTTDAIEQEQ